MVDYIHLFNYAGAYFSFNDGRQLNFIDYSQYFPFKSKLLISPDTFKQNKYLSFPSTDLRNIEKCKYQFILPHYFDNPENKTLLCDFVTLLLLIEKNIPLKYEQIYILDCFELTIFFRDIEIPHILDKWSNIFNFKEFYLEKMYELPLTFLITDYNKDDLSNFNYEIYYKKINFDIIKTNIIKSERKDGLIYYYSKNNADEEFLEKIKNKYSNIIITDNYQDIFSYQNILYTPKPYVKYIEQFGRMVFELQGFDYNVVLDHSFKREEKTGLEYYLEYYENKSIDINEEDFLSERINLQPLLLR